MKARAWSTMLVAAVASALVWALSPWLVGYREPWDADGLYYVAALLVTGAFAGLLAPKPLWAHYVGALVGQLGYELLSCTSAHCLFLARRSCLATRSSFSLRRHWQHIFERAWRGV